MMYVAAKHSHLLFVVITALLFNLRFWLRFFRPLRPLPKALRILPHVNDTLLLLTGLLLILAAGWVPFGNAVWLGVKLVLVLVYIGFGFLCIKNPPRSAKSNAGYLLAMLCLAVIYYLARYKPLWF
ncbi:SirB2 family protein [Neisseria shayeganii]|uniref:SirB family protein n=1 Tax=Neisseria shayeganii 871 TaxID=1032488 RepID=G4CGX7_9NEIS|nr:SirB2 family protein [Neisseria shayeganii]EGY52920.1 SirB family protein [Neisseria shayeganii 871]